MIIGSNLKDIMEWCYLYANRDSDDIRTVNAALVQAGDDVGFFQRYGANALTKGSYKTEDRLKPPGKYLWTEHAERNAIFAAAKDGMSLDGATMYCPWAACADCARAIVQSGIKTLVRHKQAMEREMDGSSQEKWLESIAVGDRIMSDGGVFVHDWDHLLSRPIPVLFCGELWTPPWQ